MNSSPLCLSFPCRMLAQTPQDQSCSDVPAKQATVMSTKCYFSSAFVHLHVCAYIPLLWIFMCMNLQLCWELRTIKRCKQSLVNTLSCQLPLTSSMCVSCCARSTGLGQTSMMSVCKQRKKKCILLRNPDGNSCFSKDDHAEKDLKVHMCARKCQKGEWVTEKHLFYR